MDSLKLVFIQCLLALGLFAGQALSFQPEFIRSFLTRPWMLTNNSLSDPAPPKALNLATLSVYLDNWSPHNLVLASDEIRSGTFSTGLQPHDLNPYSRDLAMRSSSSRETQKTSGLIAWTLVDEHKAKLAILSIAWEVGNGIGSRFSVQLGDQVPTFEQLWEKSPNNKMASTNQLDNTVYVGGMTTLRFVVAANMTMNEGDILHYRLRMSLVPPNIDVWGWVKYYREPFEALLATSKSPMVDDKSVSTPPPPRHSSDEEIGMFEQKHLLTNDRELDLLTKHNLTLRSAMVHLQDTSIAVGILIENWSAYPLSSPTVELTMGKVVNDNDLIPAPGQVQAGAINGGIVLQGQPLTGTSGVIRWSLGSSDIVLSVMWSVPYNRQLWRTWVAVGLSSHTDLPTYKDMYSGEQDSRFTRRQAGHRFEFSDGRFIVIAEMDGDSTFKPVLRVGLVPRDNSLLASSIRQKLGLKPSSSMKLDINSDFNYQKTQEHIKRQDDIPSVGLVQSTTGSGIQGLRTLLSVSTLFFSSVISRLSL